MIEKSLNPNSLTTTLVADFENTNLTPTVLIKTAIVNTKISIGILPGHKKGPPDVGEEADSRFWHGENGVFCCDAVFPVDRQSHPAAHRDPINEGNVRHRQSPDQVIEPVLIGEKLNLLIAGSVILAF